MLRPMALPTDGAPDRRRVRPTARPTDGKIDLVTMLRLTGEILAGLTSEKRANYK